MRQTSRRGFTLVELLVAVVLMAIVGQAVLRVLTKTQRATVGQTEQTAMQANVRAGMLVLANELRELGYDSLQIGAAGSGALRSDLLETNANWVEILASRGMGFICQWDADELWLRRSTLLGTRLPKVKDSLHIYVEQSSTTGNDDFWIRRAVSAVDAGSDCGGAPAVKVTLHQDLSEANFGNLKWATAITSGSPVRFAEIMRYGLYVAADGRSWLGARSVSADEDAYQPVVGPLAPGNGVEFVYRNAANGTVAASSSDATLSTVRSIDITLRGQTERSTATMAGSGAPAVQGWVVQTRVALRNNLRP